MTQLSFQADYPGAMVYGADSTNVLNPPANHPKGFVLHTPEEPADGDPGTPRWFARPNVGGSTTYFVSYLGFVVQCVPENVGAIANGVTPPLPYPVWADSNISLNRQTLSVEIEGYAATIAQTISPAQKTALLNLIRHRCLAHGIPMDRQHIIGHYEVANNRTDPGTLNIDAIVAELQEDDMALADHEKWHREVLDRLLGVLGNTDEAVKQKLLEMALTDDAIKEVLARHAAYETRLKALESVADPANVVKRGDTVKLG